MKLHRVKISGFDPLLFFRKTVASQKDVSFLHGGQWSILGFNPVKKLVTRDWKKVVCPKTGIAIGCFSYDGDLHVNYYEDFLRYDNFNKKIFTSVPAKIKSIWKTPCAYRENIVTGFKPEMSKRDYDKAYKKIQEYILEGDIYQVNLTHRLVANFDGNKGRRSKAPSALADLFCKILETNPAPFAAYLDCGDTKVLSASPERFLRLEGDKIYTCPVKGTRPRGRTPLEDIKLRDELIASKKEEAELNMITDLLRNDIGQVSEIGSVKVVKHRALQKCPTVWHTYSEVVGRLRDGLSAVDLLHACFPGGSITGCPKKRSMEIIDELEPVKRGVYTGAIGYIDSNGDMDTNIVIRTLVAHDGKLFLNVGGGIVADSTCESEYEETLDKAKSFLRLKETSAIFDPANKKVRGVFETMRTYNGKIFELDAHLERLKNSAKIIGMKLPYKLSEIKKMILETPVSREVIVKVVATPNDVAIKVSPLVIDPIIYKGVSATFYKIERRKPKAKALPYNKSFEAHEYAISRGFYESLLVNKKGFVKEGAYSNLFWVKDGQVFTVGRGVLEGVTRSIVCKSVPVRFAEITPAKLKKADEVFITKTSTGVVPITEIDGVKIESGKTTKMLMKLLPTI
jgi:para-aminobenzoate synthetase component 1